MDATRPECVCLAPRATLQPNRTTFRFPNCEQDSAGVPETDLVAGVSKSAHAAIAKVCIVDPHTGMECPSGTTGEFWVHGGNVATVYGRKPRETAQIFGATLVAARRSPSSDDHIGHWLFDD
jgi:acyl-CoA synthetase (AMP-forming)/AMP-acid ligase II